MSKSPYVLTDEWKILEQEEKDALHQLTLFVKISDMFEELVNEIHASSVPIVPTASQDGKKDVAASHKPIQHSSTTSTTTTVTNSISSFNLPPRPSKLSTFALSTPDLTHNNTASSKDSQFSKAEGIDPNIRSSWREDTSLTGGNSRELQTRFIPSIGWCIRYASNVSQGGRYRLMFFDGATLDIDVDEDWVEFKNQSGETTM
ncbi:hypothetical protein C0995_004670 [Termitomyces sp. Mi166|nr:hypothetical protein C0995_004670 [Termitomyces sp. Mi166\